MAILDVNAETGAAAAEEIGCISRRLDVRDADAMHAAITSACEDLGGLPILVNNAGAGLPYPEAKAGVIALTESAARAYARAVRVNCVAPGLISTPLTEPLFTMPELLGPIEEAMLMSRPGTVTEVADVILFLASGMSSYVTGQTIVVDGGMSLAGTGADAGLAMPAPPAGAEASKPEP